MKENKFDKFLVAEYNSKNYLDVCQLRKDIFIVEQEIEEADEFDGIDKAGTLYYCGYINHFLVASVVVLPDESMPKTARIARVLVLRTFRKQGYGSNIMKLVIDDIKNNQHYDYLLVNSQEAAKNFYIKLGFKIFGEKNMEAGIPHISLLISLR